MQPVAYARLAIHRHAGSHEVCNVAVNRPLANLKHLCKVFSGQDAAATQLQNYLKEAIRGSHQPVPK